MFASALAVGLTSMLLYTGGDVYKVTKFVKQQQDIITVLFEKRADKAFLNIKSTFEKKYPHYRLLIEDEVDHEYAVNIVSGDFYDKKYLELIDNNSKKTISRFIVVYSSKKKDGGQTFLKFLLSGEGSQILKRSSYSVR